LGLTESLQTRSFLNNSFAYSFLGIDKLNLHTKRFVFYSSCLSWSFYFVLGLTNTIFILYALDFLSPSQVGVILACQFILQGITDYPTGAIGDWIGQRWILATSAFSFTIGFVILSHATGFTGFLLASMALAIANSQQSGAFSAWFDNNYKMYATEDPDKKIYMEFMGKNNMIYLILFAMSVIIGGFLASRFGRAQTYFLQGILMGIYIFLFLVLLHDHPSVQRQEPNFKQYFYLLQEGVRVSWNNRVLRLILLGFILSISIINLWGNLMLIPFYESYAKTDDLIGVMRSVIYLFGAIIMFGLASVSKKLKNPRKWLIISSFAGFPFFFSCILILSILVPSSTQFSLFSYIIVLVMFIVGSFFMKFMDVLMPRFYLELIPDKNRNSIYSLQPTLILLGSFITVLLGGILLEIFSTASMIFIILIGTIFGGMITAKGVASHSEESKNNS
jgi:MFS family permease